jgi:hypothetical protein
MAKSGRSGSVGKGTGRHRKSGAMRSGSARTPRPKGSGHQLVPVICSECYEDFMFDSGVNSDTLTCPVCEHMAERPDDAELHDNAKKRAEEKMNFLLCLIATIVGMGGFGAFLFLSRTPETAKDDAMFWGPIGAGFAAVFALIFLSVKYEGNRYETYF